MKIKIPVWIIMVAFGMDLLANASSPYNHESFPNKILASEEELRGGSGIVTYNMTRDMNLLQDALRRNGMKSKPQIISIQVGYPLHDLRLFGVDMNTPFNVHIRVSDGDLLQFLKLMSTEKISGDNFQLGVSGNVMPRNKEVMGVFENMNSAAVNGLNLDFSGLNFAGKSELTRAVLNNGFCNAFFLSVSGLGEDVESGKLLGDICSAAYEGMALSSLKYLICAYESENNAIFAIARKYGLGFRRNLWNGDKYLEMEFRGERRHNSRENQ